MGWRREGIQGRIHKKPVRQERGTEKKRIQSGQLSAGRKQLKGCVILGAARDLTARLSDLPDPSTPASPSLRMTGWGGAIRGSLPTRPVLASPARGGVAAACGGRRRGMFLPRRGRMSAQLTGEGGDCWMLLFYPLAVIRYSPSSPASRELPPLGEAHTRERPTDGWPYDGRRDAMASPGGGGCQRS